MPNINRQPVPNNEIDTRPEGWRYHVSGPMVRLYDVTRLVALLGEHGEHNSLSGETSFFHYPNPDTPLDFSYANGTEDLGFFVMFPKEANSKPMKPNDFLQSPVQVADMEDIIFADPSQYPEAAIGYDDCLFVTDDIYQKILHCLSRDDALQVIDECEFNLNEVEQHAILQGRELIKNREFINYLNSLKKINS